MIKMTKQCDGNGNDCGNSPDLPPEDSKFEHVSNLNNIVQYLHCGMCLKQSGDKSYQPWLEVGWTQFGIQIWCRIHDVNIVHMDFEGSKHRADQTRQRKMEELK
jgi:hypothetical protein